MIKSLFDEDCDTLKRQLKRLEDRRYAGKPVQETVPVKLDLLEMLLEDHYDLLKLRPR